MSDSNAESTAPSRLRYSTRSVLIMMAMVGLVLVVMKLRREIQPLRAEVRRLRDEVGELVIDDESKIHVIRVNTRDELSWKWRVWVPQGHAIEVHVTDDVSPKLGASGGGSIWLRNPGENVLEFRIEKDRRDDRWYGALSAGSGSVGKYEQPWVNWPATSTSASGVGLKTESFEVGKRIELTRHVVTQSAVAGMPTPTTTPTGFAIWLEPAK
jgi:hypothetical protein